MTHDYQMPTSERGCQVSNRMHLVGETVCDVSLFDERTSSGPLYVSDCCGNEVLFELEIDTDFRSTGIQFNGDATYSEGGSHCRNVREEDDEQFHVFVEYGQEAYESIDLSDNAGRAYGTVRLTAE